MVWKSDSKIEHNQFVSCFLTFIPAVRAEETRIANTNTYISVIYISSFMQASVKVWWINYENTSEDCRRS